MLSDATCVYCGSRQAVTRDHVPPRSLFRGRKPALITVPSCRPCNGSASRDDEYFLAVLALRQGSRDSTNGSAARDAVLRALHRAEGRGFARAVLGKAKRIQRVAPSGLPLGQGISFPVETQRVSRVAERIIRGLYFHLRGVPLPSTHEAFAYAEEGLQTLGEESREELHRLIIQPALAHSPLELGGSVFRCWQHFPPEDPRTSGWVLEFFEDLRVYGVTIPNAAAADT